MLTARDTVGDRVGGLDAGADDYLVKPFAFEELSARLRALSRRGPAGARRAEPRLVAGAIELDEAARRVTVGGDLVDLSPREFSLLECLLRHVGQTLSRDQLLDQAWPFSVAVTLNAVDAYVHYLRYEARLGEHPARDGPRDRLPADQWLSSATPAPARRRRGSARRAGARGRRPAGPRSPLAAGPVQRGQHPDHPAGSRGAPLPPGGQLAPVGRDRPARRPGRFAQAVSQRQRRSRAMGRRPG